MFWLICIELSGIIFILYWYYTYKYKKLSPLKKFILYCEKEDDIDFSYITDSFRSFEIFELMSEFRPKLFAKYFTLYSLDDIEKKRNFIINFSDEMLKVLFKYSDYATLKNLFYQLSYKKMYFMLDWLCKNRFNEFLPLLRGLDINYNPTKSPQNYLLFNIIYTEHEAIKFVKYFDDVAEVIIKLRRRCAKMYLDEYHAQFYNLIDELLESFDIPTE